jgi:hypothetical protein
LEDEKNRLGRLEKSWSRKEMLKKDLIFTHSLYPGILFGSYCLKGRTFSNCKLSENYKKIIKLLEYHHLKKTFERYRDKNVREKLKEVWLLEKVWVLEGS